MAWFSISCRRVVCSLSMVDRNVMVNHRGMVDIMVNRVVDRDLMVDRVVNSMVVMTMMHHVSHMWILLHVVQWHMQVKH